VTEGRFGVVVVSLALYELALLELRSGSDKGREIRGVDGPPSRTLGRRLGRPAWHLTADGGVPMLPGVGSSRSARACPPTMFWSDRDGTAWTGDGQTVARSDSSARSRPANDAGSAGSGADPRRAPPRLRMSSAVMFVQELDRSLTFYQELLGLKVALRDEPAALLVSPEGFQLYLRSMGPGAQHPLGFVGIQYVVWTADGEEDLQRCERVLRRHSALVGTQTVDGFTWVEGRGPDDVPVVVTYPGPDRAPRHHILQRIYQW